MDLFKQIVAQAPDGILGAEDVDLTEHLLERVDWKHHFRIEILAAFLQRFPGPSPSRVMMTVSYQVS